MSEIDFEQARLNMIEQQIRPWEVLDQRVLDTLANTPRENFVPPQYRTLAFADIQLPLGYGEVMMTPKVEGRLLQALALQPSDRVLEIGTGSGYLTACLAQLGASVLSVDIRAPFSEAAQAKLNAYALSNARVRTGDAAEGWGTELFDAIALTGSVPCLSERWPRQLTLDGRLFVIVGEPPIMEALLITRIGEHEWSEESLFDTDILPLINARKPVGFEL